MSYLQTKALPAVRLAVIAGLTLVVLAGGQLFAAALPALTGRVVDQADIIDAGTEAAIVEKLRAHEAQSSDQVVVATIDSLEGEVLEEYANRLFREWGLGQAEQNNGVLLLVAKNDRKIRIEVGYGLEGTLTDLHAKLIIDNTIVPAFRAGDFAGGIAAGVDDILTVLSGNGDELEARLRQHEQVGSWIDYTPVLFFGLFFLFFGSIFVLLILAPIFGKKIGPGRYRWLGMTVVVGGGSGRSSGSSGWSSGGGGFSGGGGSSGGGGASGSW